jgi:hypothetical protein
MEIAVEKLCTRRYGRTVIGLAWLRLDDCHESYFYACPFIKYRVAVSYALLVGVLGVGFTQ